MNTERIQTTGAGFDIPGLRAKARFHFKTASSIGFRFANEGCCIIGAMQVHHPCSGHIKTRIHFQLPKQYCDNKLVLEIGMQAFQLLDIPRDETYEFEVDCAEGDGLILNQRVDRNGTTDGIASYA